MKKERSNIQLSSYDDIFGDNKASAEITADQVVEIPLSQLHPFKYHPFKVRDDEEMQKTVESIRELGVLTPAICRADGKGGYEILSGHRRHHASEIAGLETLPCIVKDLDDDAATILMVDSNLQREEILPSERAFAYKMKLDAMKRQAGRPSKENVSQLGTDLLPIERSDKLMADELGTSRNQIQRYIRLTNLVPELLDMVDEKVIGLNTGVTLSFLDDKLQKDLLSAMDYAQAVPSLEQAQRIKKLAQTNEITQEGMNIILSEEKKTEVDRVTLKHDTLKKYFPKSYTPKQMEDTIIKLLDQWQKKRERDLSR